MKGLRIWGKYLLWLHLFVCCVWLFFFRALYDPGDIQIPVWVGHIVVISLFGVQFTWGLTIGLLVGPGRKRRHLLWWSLLTIFFPLWFFSWIIFFAGMVSGPGVALLYLLTFVVVLASETFCGVLLGAHAHSSDWRER